jgi:hypothetical protein
MASVLADEPAEMTTTGSQAPGHVVTAILRAIEKSPDDRWWSAAAFAQALREPGTPRDTAAAKAEEKKERGVGCAPLLVGAIGLGYVLLERLSA